MNFWLGATMISLARMSDPRVDFVAHAIVQRPVEYFEDRLGGFDRALDDLDYYDGGTFFLDDGVLFALRHYDGYPANTVAIFLDGRIRDADLISRIVQRIASELEVENSIAWQRDEERKMDFAS